MITARVFVDGKVSDEQVDPADAYGYPLALGLMFAAAAGVSWFFRRKDWLSPCAGR